MINKAREIINEHCISSCDAECCRSGKSLTLNDEKILLNPCPKLKDNRCSIYNERPTTCKTFPIRLAKFGSKEIVIINNCKAVRSGLIDDQIKELEKHYKIFR